MRVRFAPIYGVLIFVIFYYYASLLYPGGSAIDPHSAGFSWKLNYWCDLLDLQSLSSEPNPARPVAIASMIVLAMALSYFWIQVAEAFPGKYSRWLIGLFGPLSMLAAIFLFTPFHDILIYVGGPMGIAAFVATLYQIRHEKISFLFSLIPAAFAVVNFIFWHFKYSLEWLPLIQKLAFASFFVWVCYLTQKMAKIPRPISDRK